MEEFNYNDELFKKYFPLSKGQNLNKNVLIQQINLDRRKREVEKRVAIRKDSAPKTIVDEAVEKKKGIEKRLDESDIALSQLIQFGGELVTNVKLANEKREILRRNEEALKREELLNDLENESNLASDKFDEITSKWSDMKTIKEPMSLFEELEIQKKRITNIMKQKDDIIKKCEEEINRTDSRYNLDEQRQSTDIYTLVERVNNQIDLIKHTFNKHLELLQDTIEEERTNISLAASNKWQQLYDKHATNENKTNTIKKERDEFYENEIDRITREQNEITRATRIRLEKDTEILQLELRTVKTNVTMNSEKLNYNYQVLQKRNEENILVNNQQKHRVTKIKDTISLLKKKIRETKINSEINIKKLTNEVINLHARITELEKKSENFKINNEKKYNSIWDINYQEAINLLHKILNIDKILNEQQLGLEWSSPEIPNARKRDNLNIKKKNSLKVAVTKQSNLSIDQNISDTRLLRNILRRIADRGGFLLEEKLLEILEPYSEEDKALVRMDNIFDALRINNFNDVKVLIDYFLPYANCPNCGQFTGLKETEFDNIDSSKIYVETVSDVPDGGTLMSSIVESELPSSIKDGSYYDNESIMSYATDEIDKNINNLVGFSYNQKGSGISQKDLSQDQSKSAKCDSMPQKENKSCSEHYLVINPSLVLTALREFAEKHLNKSVSTNGMGKLKKDKIETSEVKVDVKNYWNQFLSSFSEAKQKQWKLLEHGLNHYLIILKDREELDTNCEFLRRQNAELKYLLQKYLKKN